MKILLLSRNHTVQEMIALALRGIEGVDLVISREIDETVEDNYSWVIIDDSTAMYQESIALVKSLGNPQTIVLHQPGNMATELFDFKIQKPFLPAEIHDLIEANKAPKPETVTDKPKKKKKKKKKKSKNTSPSGVLDLNEIETIKALLAEDGIEVVSEEELPDVILADKGENKEMEEKLLAALRHMRPKKIRKLLKGAKVEIKITFPKEN